MTKTPKTILLTTVLGAALAVGGVAAEAKPGGHTKGPAKAGKAKGPAKAGKAKGHAKKCAKPRKVGFVVKGTFVSGADKSVTLKVTKANRHARESGLITDGENFTAVARTVRYLNSSGPADAEVGDKVRVVGKVTKLKKGCPASGFTPAASVRKVTVLSRPETPAGSEGTVEAPGEDSEEFAAL